MAKIKRFDILTVPIKVECKSSLIGWILGVFKCLTQIRVRMFTLTIGGKSISRLCGRKPLPRFYRLIVPYISGVSKKIST